MPILNGTGKSRELTLPERVDPAGTALVIIDVQKDFCSPAFACGKLETTFAAMPAMLERLKELLSTARSARMLIVHVRASYDPVAIGPVLGELYERRGFGTNLCREGTDGIEFMDGIVPQHETNEVVVTKHRFSAFWGTDLDLLLRSNGIRSVCLAGVVSEVCVESTARDAFFRDYYVVVAGDAIASFSPERNAAAQVAISRSFGRVMPTDDLITLWQNATVGQHNWEAKRKAVTSPPELSERLAPMHTALILIDVQNDFCSEQGVFAKGGKGLGQVRRALTQMQALLGIVRAAGCMIVHVKSEYSPLIRHVGSPYRKAARNIEGSTASISASIFQPTEAFDGDYTEICAPGGWGAEFLNGFGPRDDELLVVKHRFSAFVDTRLDLLLRSNGIQSVVIAGVTTNCCVETAVRNACMLDYRVTVAEDAVGAWDQITHLHKASLETMRTYFARVMPVSEIAQAWVNRVQGAA